MQKHGTMNTQAECNELEETLFCLTLREAFKNKNDETYGIFWQYPEFQLR